MHTAQKIFITENNSNFYISMFCIVRIPELFYFFYAIQSSLTVQGR